VQEIMEKHFGSFDAEQLYTQILEVKSPPPLEETIQWHPKQETTDQ